MEARESNLICDIRKSIRRYNMIVSEYNKIKERENLINSEILYNINELEQEIRYLRFHLRYLAYKCHQLDSNEIDDVIENLKPNKKSKRRKNNGIYK